MESESNRAKRTAKGRKIAAVIADGYDCRVLDAIREEVESHGALLETVAPRLGEIRSGKGKTLKADKTFSTTHSVLYDAVCVPGGDEAVRSLRAEQAAGPFLMDAYAHAKPLCIAGAALDAVPRWLPAMDANDMPSTDQDLKEQQGVVMQGKGNESDLAKAFLRSVASYRHWGRARRDA